MGLQVVRRIPVSVWVVLLASGFVPLALVGAVVAEFVGAHEGMGVLIEQFNFQLNIAEAFAVVVWLSIIGVVLFGIVDVIDRRVAFWQGRSSH